MNGNLAYPFHIRWIIIIITIIIIIIIIIIITNKDQSLA